MNIKKNWRECTRGWIPKEPSMPISNVKAVKAPTMSEREKVYKLKVAAVFLAACGVFAGWYAAGRAYGYFVGNGATSYDATVYSVIVWIIVIAIFCLAALLAAFKAKRITHYAVIGNAD